MLDNYNSVVNLILEVLLLLIYELCVMSEGLLGMVIRETREQPF